MTRRTSVSYQLTRRGIPAAVAVGLVVAITSTTASTAAAASGSHKLISVPQGLSPKAVQSKHALEATNPSTPMNISIILKARNYADLGAKVTGGWTGPYLTTSQFASRYGQTPYVINRITSYLQRFGITTNILADRLDITANGTVAEFNRALHINEQDFRVKQASAIAGHHARKTVIRASKRDPRVPASVGSSILAIMGLSNYAPFNSDALRASNKIKQLHVAKPSSGVGIPSGTGLAPSDFVSRYNLAPLESQGATGQGETIGIVTFASINPATPLRFWDHYLGLNEPASRLQLVPVDGGAGAVSGTAGSDETDLDVEQSGAIAPGAAVRVYEAPNNDTGFSDALYGAASDNVADSVSMSWGSSETIIQAGIANSTEPAADQRVVDEAFAEMGAQGQSSFVSAGDEGAYTATSDLGTTDLAVDNPGSSPYVTSAGGTTLPAQFAGPITDSDGNVTSIQSVTIPKEIAWSYDYLWPIWQLLGEPSQAAAATDFGLDAGGGGGYSLYEPRPSYQQGLVGSYNARKYLLSVNRKEVAPGLTEPTQFEFDPTPGLTSGTNTSGRAQPDVSADADPDTGYAVFDPKIFSTTGGFAQYGGTSFVAPQLNGTTAVIDSAVGHRVGFWNPVIYAAAQSSHSPFNPINETRVYAGKGFLAQSDPTGHNITALPGSFSNNNLYYTGGGAGSLWSPAVGLGTPNLTSLSRAFANAAQ